MERLTMVPNIKLEVFNTLVSRYGILPDGVKLEQN